MRAVAARKHAEIRLDESFVINGEQCKMAAGIDVVHVPQRGTPDALIDTVIGRVHYFFAPLGNALPGAASSSNACRNAKRCYSHDFPPRVARF